MILMSTTWSLWEEVSSQTSNSKAEIMTCDHLQVLQAVSLPPASVKTLNCASLYWKLAKGALSVSFYLCHPADTQHVSSAVKNPLVRIPSCFTLMTRSPRVFQLFTAAQENASGKRLFWPRGEHRPYLCLCHRYSSPNTSAKMLGGCALITCVDALFLSALFRFFYQRTGVSTCDITLSFC
jgi:hypothetical protein